MSSLFGGSSFFGLDIGTSGIRLVQLEGSGPVKYLVKYAYMPIDGNIALSDSAADRGTLGKLITELLGQARPSTKNVAVGVPSSRVFTTVADVDKLSSNELAKSIRFQADSLIPTPLNESKIDWALLGDSPVDAAKQEILLTSVPNNFIESRLDMLESIGLNVVAFEPDNLAMARALVAPDSQGAQIVLDLGNKSSDLVVVFNGKAHLTRSLPTGLDSVVKSAIQNLNIDPAQAQQFVTKFGLNKEKLDGQVYQAIISTVDIITSEIEKTIKYFASRYHDSKVERIIVTGNAATFPEFPLHLANKVGINVELGNSWRNVSFKPNLQNELMSVSNQFSVAAGLAERNS